MNEQEEEFEDEEPERSPLDVDIRYTEASDAIYLKKWLMDPEINRWFPMADEVEIDDAVNRWVGFYRYRCSLTAVYQGTPVALSTLYLQPYRKLAHQCEFGIIVAPEFRGQKIGTEILNNLIHLAKTNFKIELLHLQVYEGNPATRLYERMGFKAYGKQTHWIKEKEGVYTGRIFMERFI